MRIQKRGLEPVSVSIPERGFYTEADISEIIKRAVQEVMLTFVEDDDQHEDNSTSASASDKKLTVSVKEAADMLGISKPKMFELLNSGQIPHKRIGKKIIISYQAVADWVYQ